jgi:hypothetical protein
MPQVLISFMDGEILNAETPEITFDLAVLEAELRSVDSNAERALIPVSAIRQMLVGEPREAPPSDQIATWDRAAFHFVDGHVMRASISPEAMLGRHGGVWQLVEPGARELRTVAIPYTALKGVFHIRRWDSRPPVERTPFGRVDQLARILAERDAQSVTGVPARKPLLSRMRRPPDAP